MTKSEIQIVDTAEACHIDIEGTIGVPEEWQFEVPEERVATYDKFREALRRITEIKAPEVVVNIRSTGGDVNDALLIHDALRTLDARITTRCYGYTASAATIIAQAATEGCRELSANALYLIHNAVCATEGNAAELESRIELLRQTDARIAGIYANRSGHPVEEFEALMAENNGNGRWLSPDETIAAGLADRIIEATEHPIENHAEHPRIHGWKRLLASIGIGQKSGID
ncbi:MAG: ATP-dependent Clp protease proteolytic subunit, partial [Alistipes sp.]|nr:ATP-dependent Clp protease proteolytic subunit [Alistipes sp.]